jgi:hypothetical protein
MALALMHINDLTYSILSATNSSALSLDTPQSHHQFQVPNPRHHPNRPIIQLHQKEMSERSQYGPGVKFGLWEEEGGDVVWQIYLYTPSISTL